MLSQKSFRLVHLKNFFYIRVQRDNSREPAVTLGLCKILVTVYSSFAVSVLCKFNLCRNSRYIQQVAQDVCVGNCWFAVSQISKSSGDTKTIEKKPKYPKSQHSTELRKFYRKYESANLFKNLTRGALFFENAQKL